MCYEWPRGTVPHADTPPPGASNTGRASTSNSGNAYKSSAGHNQPVTPKTPTSAGPVISAPARTGKRGGAGGGIWDGRLCAMSAGHRH